MDQDSLDFNIKLNDEQTVPDVEENSKKQNQHHNSEIDSQFSKQNTMTSQISSNQEQSNFDLSAAAHPYMCVITFIFKATAIFCYFFLNFLKDDTVTFITILLLSCIDFWAVKNVTARFLVGLKWWNEFDEEGNEVWLYESMPPSWEAHTVDKTIFWFSQIIATLFFAVMLIINVLSFTTFWSILNTICLVLYGTNFYGFYKCRGQHQKKAKELMGKVGLKVLTGF